jgi:hypothetical protein
MFPTQNMEIQLQVKSFCPIAGIPKILEEGNQEETKDEYEIEVTQSTTTKKVGRKSNCNRRENEADWDKELGIQTTWKESKRMGNQGNPMLSQ